MWDGNAAIGIIAAKDLIPHLRQREHAPPRCARDVMRPPYFVPGSELIPATLDGLRRQRSLLAIVLNDEGAAIGLVTVEDLLEEIVGEIQDESDSRLKATAG